MNKAHPCAKLKKSVVLPLTHSPSAFLSAPCYHSHLFPFQMVMALNHAGVLQLEVNSLLRREFMDRHAGFLRFGPAGAQNFSSWLNHFGHSFSGLPQYTTGLWLLLSCIMEENPDSVPSLYTSPSTYCSTMSTYDMWWMLPGL